MDLRSRKIKSLDALNNNNIDSLEKVTISKRVQTKQPIKSKGRKKVNSIPKSPVLVSDHKANPERKKPPATSKMKLKTDNENASPVKRELLEDSVLDDRRNKKLKNEADSIPKASVGTSKNIDAEEKTSISTATNGNEKRRSMELHHAIDKTLKEQYLNITERFKVNIVPQCLSNLLNCKMKHHVNNNILATNRAEFSQLKILVENDRPEMFLNIVKGMLMKQVFPDKPILLLLLELLLTINEPKDESYTTNEIIDGCALTFSNLIRNFPPCWSATNGVYRRLLKEPLFQTVILKDKEFDPSCGLLENLINLLDTVLQPDYTDDPNVSIESESFQNFFAWEEKNQQKFLFKNISRNEKIDRIFLALSLFLDLLESDLAIWMMKNAMCPFKKMMKEKTMPLIACFLWDIDDVGQTNALIKKILEIFVCYISIDFPADKLETVGRLVNLVYQSMQLCEVQPDAKEIELLYPKIHNQCQLFCDLLAKKIEANVAYSADLYAKVIENITVPVIKWKLVARFFKKLNGHEVLLRPENIYTLMKRQNKYFSAIADTSTQLNAKPSPVSISTNDHSIYPCLNKQKRKATTSLSEEKYTELILIAFRAYNQVYHIKELHTFLKEGVGLKEKCEEMTAKNQNEKENQTKKKPTTVDYIKKNWQMLVEKELENAGNSLTFALGTIDFVSFPALMENFTIEINEYFIQQYREDLKFYEIIMQENNPNTDYIKRRFKRFFQ